VDDPAPSDDPLGPALRAVVTEAVEQWERVQGDTPELLYHYTDVTGLIGICSSASLWATNLRFMNDAKELSHAGQLMLEVLGRARARASEPGQHSVIDAVEADLTAWDGYPDFYSVSFSAAGDLLGQWRGYGASGGGYAIGLDPSRLLCPPTARPQPYRFLNRIIYDQARQMEILCGVAERMLALLKGVPASGPDLTAARARAFSALGEVAGYMFSFKDPAWAEEREWRAVYVLPPGDFDGVRFRAGRGVAVPFVSLAMGTDPGGRLPIRRIVQGPSVEPETSANSLELLLASNGYTNVDIVLSEVPLRA
jgi:hypothetical protein